jgi:phage major head subunit gpT-like protein
MPVARNMKELEKIILGQVKKKLPSATRDYCHKWYGNHPEMKEIVSEEKFISMVNESMKVSIVNGELNAKFGIFQNEDIQEEHLEHMKQLWEEFKSGYMEYVSQKILK